MEKFNFISDDAFRNVLVRDYGELHTAIERNAWKSAIVLAGSIVEAVLTDHLIEIDDGKDPKNSPLNMTLGQLLDVCKKAKVISSRTANLAEVLKDYRNLIHPGKEIRSKDTPNAEIANVASSLLEIILTEVSQRRERSKGFTANQFISKIELDTAAAAVAAHLINRMAAKEVEKLLDHLIIENFFRLSDPIEPIEAPDFFKLTAKRDALAKAYRIILDHAPEQKKISVLEKVPNIIQEYSEDYVRDYLENFFLCKNLSYYNEKDKFFIIDYILEMLNNDISDRTIECCGELFSHIPSKQIRSFIDCFMKSLNKEVRPTHARLERFLIDEGDKLEPDEKVLFIKRINDWRSHWDQKGQSINANLAKDVAFYLEIPF